VRTVKKKEKKNVRLLLRRKVKIEVKEEDRGISK
jgi:hypothetical protein